MAKRLNYDGQGSGTTNDTSEKFEPKASFMLMAVGAVQANVTFTVEWLPDNLPENTATWYEADGTAAINASTRLAKVNYAKGFQYRIKRTGTGNQNSSIEFYWGNVTTVQHAFG